MSKFEIAPKEDDPQRLLELNGVPAKFWLSAQEINQLIKAIAGLLGKETDLYKGEYGSIEELEAAHPLPEPGSEAQIIVVDGDNLKASWDNTNKKWFLDGVYVDPTTSAAYLLRSVFDSNGDGIIDLDNLPPLNGSASPNSVSKFIAGHKSGLTYQPYSEFWINSVRYQDSRELSSGAADPDLDRFDVFAIEIATRQIVILPGTPDANPVKPSVDPLTHLDTGVFISIKAGANAPDGISSEVVYSEANEWTVLRDVTKHDINNAEFPASGVKAIKTLQPQMTNEALSFAPPAPFPVSENMELQYKIANITGGQHHWIIQGFDSNGALKSLGIGDADNYDPLDINYQFQAITIPMGVLVDIRKIMLISLSDTFEFYLDEITLSSGGGGTVDLTKAFVLAEDKKLQDQIDDNKTRIADLETAGGGAAVPNVEFVYLADSNTSQENADIINAAIQRAIPTSGHVFINETPVALDFWPCRTINWDNRVTLSGSGSWLGTKLGSTNAEPLIKSTRMSVVGAWGNLKNLYLDGEDIGTIGLDLGPNAFYKYEHIGIKNFTQIGMKTVSHILGTFDHLRIRNCPTGWHSTETTGVETGDIDTTPSSGLLASNAITMKECYWYNCSQFAINKNQGSGIYLNECDFEGCGTDGDNTTGIIKFTNMGTASPALSLVNSWMERNGGTYFQLQSSQKSKVIFNDSFIGLPNAGSIYFSATGNNMEVKVKDCGIDTTFSFGSFNGAKLLTDNSAIGSVTLTNGATHKQSVYQEAGVSVLEEEIIGTANENNTATGTVDLDLNTFTEKYLILTGNTTLSFSNTPASGKSFVRSLIVKSTTNETLTFPANYIQIGTFTADGTEHYIELKFSNFPTIGLRAVVYINKA